MRTKKKIIALLGGLLLAFNVQAATVDFFLVGQLGLAFGSDDFDLDGADITWEFSYDTTEPNIGGGSTGIYDALSVTVFIENRPNSAFDTFLNLDPDAFFQTNNVFGGAGVDSVATSSGNRPLDDIFGGSSNGLSGLTFTDFIFEFADQNFFTGTGVAALPLLTNSDVVTIFTPLIEESFTGSAGYDMSNLGVSITNSAVVPVPAAAWLFGSGLLALFGLSRRKQTA